MDWTCNLNSRRTSNTIDFAMTATTADSSDRGNRLTRPTGAQAQEPSDPVSGLSWCHDFCFSFNIMKRTT